MPLSIDKLDIFLARNEMVTSTFFVDEKMRCIMIEIYATSNDETFMLYIPSKYQITVGKGTNVFRVKQRKINLFGDIIDRYCDSSIIDSKEGGYDEIDVNRKLNDKKINAESVIEDNYNRPIKLTHKHNDKSKDMFRQINRLSLCVTSLQYKLCIYSSDNMYYIDKQNDINVLSIEINQEQVHKYRKISVLVSLETLFDKVKTTAEDVHEIKNKISHNLKRNVSKNVNPLKLVVNIPHQITSKYQEICAKLMEYTNRHDAIQKTVNELKIQERKLMEHKVELKDRHLNAVGFTLNKDIEFTKQIKILDTKLMSLMDTKKELFRNLVSLRVKHDNLLLRMDSMIFDISVMLETINSTVGCMLLL